MTPVRPAESGAELIISARPSASGRNGRVALRVTSDGRRWRKKSLFGREELIKAKREIVLSDGLKGAGSWSSFDVRPAGIVEPLTRTEAEQMDESR